ncbi:MAG: hypothetical protein HY986_15190 [Candidatus Melainabacteria bacterium]|nr:hypothetical protein [Candidatus Melainabacteria bacterium]
MQAKHSHRLVHMGILLTALSLCTNATSSAKEWTTYERQVNLMKRINAAQKSKLLTVRQAKDLRKDLSKIAVKKRKILSGAVDREDGEAMDKIEARLTKTSHKIEEEKEETREDRN